MAGDSLFSIRKVLYCPHCGSTGPQKLIHNQQYMEKAWLGPIGEEDQHIWSTFVAVCEACGHILLYDNPGNQLSENEFHRGILEYPKSDVLHHSVPELIQAAYKEAYRIREASPNAFAVQIRRALEFLCADQNAKGRFLNDKLKDLSARGVLPQILFEISDVLKLLGNIGAHGDEIMVHPLQAYAIDDFFNVLIEYLYIAPFKLREIKKHMK